MRYPVADNVIAPTSVPIASRVVLMQSVWDARRAPMTAAVRRPFCADVSPPVEV
jgi:hypothetical protein